MRAPFTRFRPALSKLPAQQQTAGRQTNNATRKALSALLASLLVTAPHMATAQNSGGLLYTVVVPSGGFGSSLFLKELLTSLTAARLFCEQLNDETLQVDCLSERLEQISSEIPEDTDYDEVRDVLANTAAELGALARQNRDRSRPRVNAASPNDPASGTSRPLLPIAPDRLAEVNAAASAILDDATTVLLRSADKSNRNQYTRIAQALESNKVLLRS